VPVVDGDVCTIDLRTDHVISPTLELGSVTCLLTGPYVVALLVTRTSYCPGATIHLTPRFTAFLTEDVILKNVPAFCMAGDDVEETTDGLVASTHGSSVPVSLNSIVRSIVETTVVPLAFIANRPPGSEKSTEISSEATEVPLTNESPSSFIARPTLTSL